jgi:hypothetical protein
MKKTKSRPVLGRFFNAIVSVLERALFLCPKGGDFFGQENEN